MITVLGSLTALSAVFQPELTIIAHLAPRLTPNRSEKQALGGR